MAERPSAAGESVDTRRYLAAVRRDLPLIGTLAAGLTIFALALSLVLPKSYTAAALVGFDVGQTTGQDAMTQERNIATQQELVTGRVVLSDASELAAKQYDVQVTPEALLDATQARQAPGKNILEIRSASDDPELAATYANVVADAYVTRSKATQRGSLDTQLRNYERAMRDATSPELRQEYLEAQQRVIAERAATEDRVIVVRAATVPGGPDSPKPLRNAILALFAGAFLGILVALMRDQLRPRFGTPRELARFLELPLLGTIPELGRRLFFGAGGSALNLRVEQEAHQSLSAALRLALPPSHNHVVMLTSSMHAEGKTTVAGRLARQLAASGHRTLLISGDLRWPRLDELMGVEGRPGLSDLLQAHINGTLTSDQLTSTIVRGADRRANLDVLPAGTLSSQAAQLLSSGSVEPLLSGIRRLGYTYVLVDAPPLLGIADAMLLARACDQLLVVARIERISVPAAVDLREELDRTGVPVLGLVAIGGVTEHSPYYSGIKPTPSEGAALTPR